MGCGASLGRVVPAKQASPQHGSPLHDQLDYLVKEAGVNGVKAERLTSALEQLFEKRAQGRCGRERSSSYIDPDIANNGLDHLKRPRRMIFIRHAESEGNVARDLTRNVPDPDLHITAKGRQQALKAGKRLRELLAGETAAFFVSPYIRARETLNGLLTICQGCSGKEKFTVIEDVRIREQEYGNFDREDIRELHVEKKTFGTFYYRFPEGESPADCYDRASLFLETLFRRWEYNTHKNYVIVSHGLMILVTLLRLMRWPVEDFEALEALKHTEFVVLERPPGEPKYDVAFTWCNDEEKDYRGLRKKTVTRAPVWDGDPDAIPMVSAPRRSEMPGCCS